MNNHNSAGYTALTGFEPPIDDQRLESPASTCQRPADHRNLRVKNCAVHLQHNCRRSPSPNPASPQGRGDSGKKTEQHLSSLPTFTAFLPIGRAGGWMAGFPWQSSNTEQNRIAVQPTYCGTVFIE
jgi:hypothetical protein